LSGTFLCPSCSSELSVASHYPRFLYWIAMIAALLMTYTAGLRGLLWLIASVILFLPINLVLLWLARRFVPPTIELAAPRSLGL